MRQKLLEECHKVLNDRFFLRLARNLLPRIRATSASKPYRPFVDFLQLLRRMFAISEKKDGTLAFRYASQIDADGWRKTSKKELARRSKLTDHQVRTCLRIAEDHGLVERRSKGRGPKQGSDLWVRLNFLRLDEMLGGSDDRHAIGARKKSEGYDWADKTPEKEDVLDEGNFTCHYKYYNNSKTIKNNDEKVRKNPASAESFSNIKGNESRPPADEDRHAFGKVLVEIDEVGLVRVASSGTEGEVFEIQNRAMEIIVYLQGPAFSEVGFPSEGEVNKRVPVRWTERLLKLFLRRVYRDGLDLEFFQSYANEYVSGETPHVCLPTFGKLLEVFPKFKDHFKSRNQRHDLWNSVDEAQSVCRMSFDDEGIENNLRVLLKNKLKFGAETTVDEAREILAEHLSETRVRMWRSFEWVAPLFAHVHASDLGEEWVEGHLSGLRDLLIDKFREDPELLLRVQHYCPAFVTRVFDDAFALDQVVGWARNNLRRCEKFYSENKDVLNDDPDYC